MLTTIKLQTILQFLDDTIKDNMIDLSTGEEFGDDNDFCKNEIIDRSTRLILIVMEAEWHMYKTL